MAKHLNSHSVCRDDKHIQTTALCHQATFRACCLNILKIKDINFLPIYTTHFMLMNFLQGRDAFRVCDLMKT